MKRSFAIITDIHGNSPALETVLKDISSKKEIDHIYCLGDVVGIGPESNKVLDLLTQRDDISFVVGNHDLAVIAAFNQEIPPRGHHKEREHHQWLADRIEPKYIEVMSKWPKQLSIPVNDKQLLFTHYHLDDEHWFLPIEKQPTVEGLEQAYTETAYQLVCFGHHHIVHHFISNHRTFFNPGSLGCYHLPRARYGIVNVNDEKVSVKTLELPYDNKSFLKSYNELEVPEGDYILKIFHGGQNPYQHTP
ncbi:metallophosphoesterase family protein [Paenibacillus eucommiae]|uniref:Phosphoesterase n=1 Tax=Paenibacillus eucommiae TaxID=1355755 RepID=A0ABS4IQC4_9BACL|nr:metallophosphoesterase family protein [Paenibacillus eucommiae]MBP1989775.1 putative phosphoesterase [Paenibacillus eucommiae]